MSWNRVYRPTKISDLHLENVRSQLSVMLRSGYIPQALLFAGPKGTGKTSTSRIIGAVLNDPLNADAVDAVYLQKKSESKKHTATFVEPTSDTPLLQHIFAGTSYVVQEMDAASNRGIDDVRSLKERVMLPPQEGKMAVYILDEAHMLTTEAFNALLKLLEEPPSHVIFILATTELHKIPETIVSRCQVIQYRQASLAETTAALAQVAKAEKLTVSDDALEAVAQQAGGSFRDAIKLLELVSQAGATVGMEQVTAAIGGSVQQEIKDLLGAVIRRDEPVVVQIFERLRSQRVEPDFFHKNLLVFLHRDLMKSLELEPGEPLFAKKITQFLLQELMSAQVNLSSPIPHLPLELKVLSLIDRSKKNLNKTSPGGKNDSDEPPSMPEKKSEPVEEKIASVDDLLVGFLTPAPAPPLTSTPSTTLPDPSATGDGQALCQRWSDLVESVAVKNTGVAALLRSAKPLEGTEGKASISVFYKFHQEQLRQPKFAALIDESAQPIAGGRVMLEFILTQPPVKAELVELSPTSLTQVASEVLM